MSTSGSTNDNREQWVSRIGVILAVAGSAVGLGNFLRFPGQAAQNGGGAFMLPYFVSLLVLGIPLCWAEWTMGRYGGRCGFNSAPGIFTAIWPNRLAKYFGALALLIPLIIYMYYVVIEAWCLGYAIIYLTGDLTTGTGGAIDGVIAQLREKSSSTATEQALTIEGFRQFYSQFVGKGEDGAVFSSSGVKLLAMLIGVFVLNFILIYRGISKGIETFCKFAMPIMAILGLIVLVRVLTLGTPDPSKPAQNVLGGLGFMWNPDFGSLGNAQTWLAASGQIFFSLSVGFGIVINYASYLRSRSDVALSGLTASSMNEFFEVCLGGMITIPAAFIFLGVLDADLIKSTFTLAFVTLPNVFNSMWGGWFFGFLWFFMLFIAAITSSISMLQPVIAFFEEGLGMKRHASVTMLGLVGAIGSGFVVYFSKGLVALDTFDFWVGTFLIYVLAMVQALLYGWVLGIRRGEQELHLGAHIRVPRVVQYMLKFVVPVYLVVIFAFFCWQSLPSSEKKQFSIDASQAVMSAGQSLPTAIVDRLAAQELTLPDAYIVEAKSEDGPWLVRQQDGLAIYVIARSDENPDQLDVSSRIAGTMEQILHNPVTLSSICFIGTVLVFLLLLTHIAGRRWEREGRLEQLALASSSERSSS